MGWFVGVVRSVAEIGDIGLGSVGLVVFVWWEAMPMRRCVRSRQPSLFVGVFERCLAKRRRGEMGAGGGEGAFLRSAGDRSANA